MNKKRILTVLIVVIVLAALMLTMHMLVNGLNLTDIMRTVHGG